MSKSIRKLSVLVLAFFAFVALSLGAFAFQAKADSDLITIATTAEVRLDDAGTVGDDTGIRFIATANKAQIAEEYEEYDATYGVVLIPTEYLDGAELDAEVAKYGDYNVLNIVATNFADDKFAAVLTNIPDSFYDTAISARAYVKLVKGEDVVVLQSADVATRSIGQVAAAKLANGLAVGDEVAVLESMMENKILPILAENTNAPEIANFDSASSVGLAQFADGYNRYVDDYS
ncbi:MAG: hypothetical protein IKV10_04475, partial [Alphaproteobacteria bacterium]|nr:hypothetical protein [Alphaproteobacteria bacterium]